jgi:phospholipid/cholesterol/gamma-HCH transport system substrate-binding protein
MISLGTKNGMGGMDPGTKSRLSDDDLLALVPGRSGRREARVGVFVVLGIVAVLAALLLLTDAGMFRGRYYVSTVVQDAGGVRKGDPVQMRGVNIGRVRSFRIMSEGVAVRLELEGEYMVPADSRVAFRSSGLLGGMVAEVVPGESRERLENGDVLPGDAGVSFAASTEGLTTHADEVLLRAQSLLSEQNVGAVSQSTQELQRLLAELSLLAVEQRRELGGLTSSLRSSADGVNRAATAPELQRAVERMDEITLRLDETITSLNRSSGSLESVIGRMERGEGTLGKLLRDDALYDNSNQAAIAANQLIEEIRRDPRRFFNVSVF